ncbi:MAG: 2-hydroxychromene-2-carboxylate isomerase [Caldimonas sp.]
MNRTSDSSDASRSVEYFFDVGSPTSYLAWTQLPKIAAGSGARIVWRPMLLGGVFKATGNTPPGSVAAKGRWLNDDIARWAKRYAVPFRFNPHFPINTLTLMRGATGVQMHRPAEFERYLAVVHRAMWEQPANLGDPALLADTLSAGGLDTAAILALAADPEVKARLVATTEEAVARGVFGAPTFFVGEAMHFGQDRLDFVREALSQ